MQDGFNFLKGKIREYYFNFYIIFLFCICYYMFMLLKARKKCTLELQVRYGDISSGSEVLGNLFSHSVLEHSTDLSHAQIHIPLVIDNATANLIGILIYVTYIQPYLKKNICIYIYTKSGSIYL